MKYGVVIVTYNRLELLKECLLCIDKQVKKFDSVLIVDNYSTDGTREYLKNKEDRYHIIYEKFNGGGAKGFKDGVAYTNDNLNVDWVLLIDDDAMLNEKYLYCIDEFLKDRQQYRAVSGTVKTDDIIDITHRKRLISKLNFNIVPVKVDEYNKEYFEYDLSSFCGLMFEKKLIQEIGVPKEEYFIWYDDSEYSLRLREYTKIANVNSAWLNHKTKKPTQKDMLNWKGYYGIRNMGDIISIYGKRYQYIFYRLRVYIAFIRNFILFYLKKDNSYKFNFNLYRDALNDMKIGKFGFNKKYHP